MAFSGEWHVIIVLPLAIMCKWSIRVNTIHQFASIIKCTLIIHIVFMFVCVWTLYEIRKGIFMSGRPSNSVLKKVNECARLISRSLLMNLSWHLTDCGWLPLFYVLCENARCLFIVYLPLVNIRVTNEWTSIYSDIKKIFDKFRVFLITI